MEKKIDKAEYEALVERLDNVETEAAAAKMLAEEALSLLENQ
ncbi:hypothetical protein [Litorimonas haliclonae]